MFEISTKIVKKIVGKKFVKNIFFEKFFCKKNIFENKFPPKKIFLLTLVEVSSSELKLEENEIFLLQWIEVG